MNYLSSIVIKLCKVQSKSNDDPCKYKIEISYSPGACDVSDGGRRHAADSSPAQPRTSISGAREGGEGGEDVRLQAALPRM